MRKFITIVEAETPQTILPLDVADARASDIYTDLGTCDRVVWEKDAVIETNELSEVGLGPDVAGVYGVHITGEIGQSRQRCAAMDIEISDSHKVF